MPRPLAQTEMHLLFCKKIPKGLWEFDVLALEHKKRKTRLTTQVGHPPPLSSSVLILLHRLRRRSHFFRWRYGDILAHSPCQQEREREGKNYSNFNAISLLARLRRTERGEYIVESPLFEREKERERLAVFDAS